MQEKIKNVFPNTTSLLNLHEFCKLKYRLDRNQLIEKLKSLKNSPDEFVYEVIN